MVRNDRKYVPPHARESDGLQEVTRQQQLGLRRRKSTQVIDAPSGAESIPASLKISHTVDAATWAPSSGNSPCTAGSPTGGTPAQVEGRGADGADGRWAAWPLGHSSGQRTAWRPVRGASATPCPAVPATASTQRHARQPVQRRHHKRPVRRVNRTSFRQAGAPARRPDAATPNSRCPCPDRSSEGDAGCDRLKAGPIATAQPPTIPRQPPRRSLSLGLIKLHVGAHPCTSHLHGRSCRQAQR